MRIIHLVRRGPAFPLLLALVTAAACPRQTTLPTATFTASATLGDPLLVVRFTDRSEPGSSAITARSWNFGDPGSGAANVSAEQNPTHTYAKPGLYPVTLRVTDANGQQASSAPIHIQVRTPSAEFTPGALTAQPSVTIGPEGATLQGTDGSPLEEVIVTIPPGALGEETRVTLGYDTGTATVPLGTPGPAALILDFEDGELLEPAVVAIPYDTAKDELVLLFHIADNSRWSDCALLDLNPVTGVAAFAVYTPGRYAWVSLPRGAGAKELYDGTADTFFRPGLNGFAMPNAAPSLSRHFPRGECYGFAGFSKFYFESYADGLYLRFNDVLPHSDPQDSYTPTVRNLIVARAHNSLSLEWENLAARLFSDLSSVTDLVTFNSIRLSMWLTGSPVLLALHGVDGQGVPVGHAVLAYKVTPDAVWIYDPNYPGQETSIPFSGLSFANYGNYTTIRRMVTSLPPHRESFHTIVWDAERNFNDRAYVSIKVDSHQNGQTVVAPLPTPPVTLKGSLASGPVAVTKFVGRALNDSVGFLAPVSTAVDYSLERPYTLAELPLAPGRNEIVFQTWGWLDGQAPGVPMPTEEQRVANQYEVERDTVFVLNVPFHLSLNPSAVTLTPSRTSARVTVSTLEGVAESEFPLRWTATSSDARITVEPPAFTGNTGEATLACTAAGQSFDATVTFTNLDNPQDTVSVPVHSSGVQVNLANTAWMVAGDRCGTNPEAWPQGFMVVFFPDGTLDAGGRPHGSSVEGGWSTSGSSFTMHFTALMPQEDCINVMSYNFTGQVRSESSVAGSYSGSWTGCDHNTSDTGCFEMEPLELPYLR